MVKKPVQPLVLWCDPPKGADERIMGNSLEEFHQHVVLAYAENIFVIFRYIRPPESKFE